MVFTFWLRLRLEGKLHGEVGPLTESVAGQREDGLQQHQAGLKVRPDGVLGHAGQPEQDTVMVVTISIRNWPLNLKSDPYS